MMFHAKFGRKLTACEARDFLDQRFFPSTGGAVEFPNLSDLLGSDWGGGECPASYRNKALDVCERIYGKAF